MASASEFIDGPGPFQFPFDQAVLTNWLRNYARFIRPSEEGVAALRSLPERFELVPIPRDLLTSFGGPELGGSGFGGFGLEGASDSGMLQGSFGAAGLPSPRALRGRGEGLAKLQAYPAMVKTFGQFVRAFEQGDEGALKATLSDDYHDESGRDKQRLLSDLKELCGQCSEMRIVPVNCDELEVVANSFVACVRGAWEATIAGESKSEFFEAEVVFVQGKERDYKISAIRLAQ